MKSIHAHLNSTQDIRIAENPSASHPAPRLRLIRRSLALLAIPLLSTSALAAPPVIEDPGTIFPGVVEFITGVEFGLQIIASGNPTSYGENNLPSGLSLNSNTGYIQGTVNVPTSGPVNVTLSATNADGTTNFPVTFEIFRRQPPLVIPAADKAIETGLDIPAGNMSPFTQSPNNTTNDFFYRLTGGGNGNDLIRNNNTGAYTTSGVRAYVMGPAEISFTWWGGIETGYDFFSFYVNEDPIPNPTSGFSLASRHPTDYITGSSNINSPTAEFTKVLGPGLNRLEWLYTKDYNDGAGGTNNVFLDNVRITGYPVWAKGRNLTAQNSSLNIDKERDGHPLLMEYALDLNPNNKDTVVPQMTFAPDGRAQLQISRNDDVMGITVDFEKSTLLTPGSWAASLNNNGSNDGLLKRIEPTPQTDAYYRLNVTAP